jgi:hypothetical protein
MKRAPFGLTTPCDNCPFRRDVKPYIRPERVLEIEHSLERAEFPCHKTTNREEDEEGNTSSSPSSGEIHCAGALILMEKEERSSQMMRIAERLGMYDPRKLNMAAPVYDSFEEMYEAHVNEERPRPRRRKKKAS